MWKKGNVVKTSEIIDFLVKEEVIEFVGERCKILKDHDYFLGFYPKNKFDSYEHHSKNHEPMLTCGGMDEL